MSRRLRLGIFLVTAPALAAAILWGALSMPQFGQTQSAYAKAINHHTVSQQRITDAVTAVNFDYRAADTLGEEFILFAAVMSVTVLLRRLRSDGRELASRRALARLRPASDALRTASLISVAPIMVLGIYIVSHGQLTPGGGFQGGALLATGVVILFVAGEYASFRSLTSARVLEAAEAVGAGGFVAMGMVGLVAGSGFLANTLPLGEVKTIASGGMVGIISALIGLEVAASLAQVVSELVEQAVALAPGRS